MSCNFDFSPLGIYHMTGAYAIPQGADWDVNIRYIDDAGVPFDFTGGTADMQVRTDYDGEIILELSTSDGTIVLGDGTGDIGNVTLRFIPSVTSVMTKYEGIYDLEVTLGGLVYKFLEGKFELRREITR